MAAGDVGHRASILSRKVSATVADLSTERQSPPARAAELTRILSTMRFVTSFAFGCAGTVRILHLDVLEFSVARIGLIMAAYSILIAVVEVPSGAIADVWGRRNTKLLASWVMVGAYVVLSGADGLVDVVISAALLGIGRALFSGAADAWFVDEIGDAKDPAVLHGLSRAEAAHNLGIALGSLTGALLPQLYGDQLPDRLVFAPIFLIGAGMLMVDLVLTWRTMHEHRLPEAVPLGGVVRTTAAGVVNALDRPVPRWTCISMVTVGGAVACTELLTPLGLAEGVGTDRALLFFGPLVAGSWGISAVASIMTGRFEAMAGSVQRASGLLLFGTALVLLPAAFEAWYLPIAAYVGVNFMLGALLPLLATNLHRHVRSSNRSTATSTLNLSMMAGAASASFLVGGLARSAALAVAAAATIAATALLVLPETSGQEDEDEGEEDEEVPDPRVVASKPGDAPLDPTVVT